MDTIITNEVKERVREIVRKNALMGQDNVTDTSRLKRDHGIDSILVVDLIVSLEEEFDIEVDFDSLSVENFSSVELITKYVTKKLSEK